MKSILVIGIGRFGRHLARKLIDLGNQVMIVDIEEKKMSDIIPIVTTAQIGDCTNIEVLKSLGVRNFDVCFVCIGSNFQSSLEITSLLRELGAKYIVSKANREIHEKFLLRNGADEVVYPEKQVAKWAAIRYASDHIFDFMEIDDQHAIFEVEIPESWAGKTIGELDVRRRFGVNILGVKRAGKTDVAVTSETTLPRDATILALGDYKALHKCFHI